MSESPRNMEWAGTAADAVAAWPRERPLAVLVSVPGVGGGPWARWSMLAEPRETVRIGCEAPDPIGEMMKRVRGTARMGQGEGPFGTARGWVVAISYEVGRTIEPRARVVGERRREDWPWAIVMWRCDGGMVLDEESRKWWWTGAGAEPELRGGREDGRFSLSGVRPEGARGEYEAAVRRAVGLIHAGDVFEVNLAHRLSGRFEGSARGLFARLCARSEPWYGAYLEVPTGGRVTAALSLSPEMFLSYEQDDREVVTRPIKGTREGSAGERVLRESAKDAAELNMIVDLMRNDLGRIGEYGSVQVSDARAIERHGGGGVLHGVATVRARLRAGLGVEELLRATFPAGSITGAPKVRAMQIIEELEARARGLYTGAIGFISDAGDAVLNVAIRTAIVSGTRNAGERALDAIVDGRLSYSVGAGIVADSVASEEWEETLVKARVVASQEPAVVVREAREGMGAVR